MSYSTEKNFSVTLRKTFNKTSISSGSGKLSAFSFNHENNQNDCYRNPFVLGEYHLIFSYV